MKKYIGFQIVVILFVLAGNSFSQIKTEGTRTEKDSATGVTKTTTYTELKEEEVITPRHDMLTINPLKFFLFWNLSYYHAFSSYIVAGLGLQTPTISHTGGFGVNGEIRIHPSHKALRGFYVAPNFSYNHLTFGSFATDGASSAAANVSSIGVLLGWQWFIGDDFAIGLGLGIDHYFVSGSGTDYNAFGSFTGNLPALRFDIGYGW